jgi:hypothetical protein
MDLVPDPFPWRSCFRSCHDTFASSPYGLFSLAPDNGVSPDTRGTCGLFRGAYQSRLLFRSSGPFINKFPAHGISPASRYLPGIALPKEGQQSAPGIPLPSGGGVPFP